LRNRLLICSLLLIVFIGCEKKDYPPVEVLQSYFFIEKKDENDKMSYVNTRVVPHKEGQSYLWAIVIRTNKDPIYFTEQMTLSGAGRWHIKGDDYEISTDRKTVTVKRKKSEHEGVLHGSWSVAKGDPEGKASIKVTIEEEVEQIFEFELKKPTQSTGGGGSTGSGKAKIRRFDRDGIEIK
jgi:hypothetical protein